MSKILVTGGAGYIGSVLVPELLKLGHDVTVMDSFIYGQSSLLECCRYDNFKVIKGDARDRALLESLTRGMDFVIPLAALVGAPLCELDKIGAETTNFGAVQTLTEVLGDSQKIIIPITNSGYGVGGKGIYCTEETPLNPISHYGKVKVLAEEAVMKRKNSISLRLATVFGASPRMRLDLLVNDFTYRAVKDRFIVIFEGHFKRNYIHIRDVVSAFIFAMDNFEKMKGAPYNVGLSDANLSKLELCAEIKKQIPAFTYIEAPVGEDPDKRDYIVSNEKVEAAGFRPEYSLGDGIRELIKAYTVINNSRYGNI
jgi:nucleoside-diphosphate-sugar epimerase